MDNVEHVRPAGYPTFYLPRWVFLVLATVHHIFAVSWLYPLLLLYAFSWRVQAIIGHWPKVYVDDPKYSTPGDWLSDFLYEAVDRSFLLVMFGVIVFPILSILLWKRYPRFWSVSLLLIYAACFVVFVVGLGDRGMWYVD